MSMNVFKTRLLMKPLITLFLPLCNLPTFKLPGSCQSADRRCYTRQLPSSCNSATPRLSALAAGKGTHLVQTLHIGVQGNPRPGTMVSERDVHSSFHCSQPFCSPFRSAWWFGRTQNKATTRQPGVLCGWSGRLEQSPIAHSFRTYIINVQKHAKDTSFYHVPTSLANYFQSTSSEHCTALL